jgi:hypothetical protein
MSACQVDGQSARASVTRKPAILQFGTYALQSVLRNGESSLVGGPIVWLREIQSSEAGRESGRRRRRSVSITVKSTRTFFFLSRHPQFFDGSSTGFPH